MNDATFGSMRFNTVKLLMLYGSWTGRLSRILSRVPMTDASFDYMRFNTVKLLMLYGSSTGHNATRLKAYITLASANSAQTGPTQCH